MTGDSSLLAWGEHLRSEATERDRLATLLHREFLDGRPPELSEVCSLCEARADRLIAEDVGFGSLRLAFALAGMVQQFAYWSNGALHTGGLSALEDAFDALGWDDPHPAPERFCDEEGCRREATCGWPTRPGGTGLNGGYRRTCGEHKQWPT